MSQFGLLSILCATLIAVHGSNIITNATQLSAPKTPPRLPTSQGGTYVFGGLGRCVCVQFGTMRHSREGKMRKNYVPPSTPKSEKNSGGQEFGDGVANCIRRYGKERANWG